MGRGPGSSDIHHPTPYERLRRMLKLEQGDLAVIVVYNGLIGLLLLAVPLAAQALVNTIAAGVMAQPLVILTLGVLAALLFAGVLRLLKLTLLERLQQRIFARIALDVAERLPRFRYDALMSEYAPQLVNRFFDVITMQKSAAKILLEGPSALLKVAIGMLLMAFYHPYLLAFDVFLVLFVAFTVGVLGLGGLDTSIEESKSKYRVADWLEDLARCQRSFKMSAIGAFPIERADALVIDYVRARESHFRVIFRQALGNYLMQAIAFAGVLAIGGWLVINRQLTLGQVVAAEIVVVGVLDGLEKLIRMLEQGYDLLTSLDKVGHLTDLPLEREGGREARRGQGGAGVRCKRLHFSYPSGAEVLNGIDLDLKPGESLSLVGESGAGKSTLAAVVCGLHEPDHGVVQINGIDVRDLRLDSLRRIVSMVSDTNEIFAGTVEENILLGREYISHEDLEWALDLTGLGDELVRLPRGLQTQLVTEGRNLSRGQIQRLLIARAIIGRPQLLIIDEGFTGIDECDKLQLLDALYNSQRGWTIIDISHDPEVVARSQRVVVLSHGRVVQEGGAADLARLRDGEFARLFPSMIRNLLEAE
jgi:ABC-type bacteriocin/lantibiotic exporter with double-glycine peptidase domain